MKYFFAGILKSFYVCLSRISLILKEAQIPSYTIELNSSLPFGHQLAPMNPWKTTGGFPLHIHQVLTMRNRSEVQSSIVGTIMVDVVNAPLDFKNKTMDVSHFSIPLTPAVNISVVEVGANATHTHTLKACPVGTVDLHCSFGELFCGNINFHPAFVVLKNLVFHIYNIANLDNVSRSGQ